MKRLLTAESPAADFPMPPQHPGMSAVHRSKKTRELPNLSNCHCCNHRINCTNPKNRLRTLTSEWRIVLLCNACHKLVESSQFCAYCLTNISSSSADFFECRSCRHRIHRSCVSMFSFGSGNGGDLSVCFDCWMPKLLENDCSRVCESRPRKRLKKESKICGDSTSLSLESSRVCDSQDKGGKSLEEMVNDANVVAQKKIAVAVEAKEKAAAKAVVARRAVEFAGGALNFVSVDKNGGNHGGGVVEDDAQLAIRLHRAMNSSPRISRNSCLLNTSSVNGCAVNGNAHSVALQSQTLVKTCVSEAVNVGTEVNVVDVDSVSCKEESGFRSVETRQEFVQNVDEREDQKSNTVVNDCLITYSRKRAASQNGRSKESNGLLKMYRRRLSHLEKHIADRDHCLKTYCRRVSTTPHCKNKQVDERFDHEHGILSSSFDLNRCENARVLTNAS